MSERTNAPPEASNTVGTGTAVGGMTWMVASNVLTRAAGLAGQVVVGWLLAPEDFGIWALAVSISTGVAAIRNGGTSQILVSRTLREYEAEEGLFFRFSLAFNLLAMTALALVALPMLRDRPALAAVLIGIALSFPVSTPAMMLRARLSLEGRFREVASINFWSGILRQVVIATLAFLGLRAMSFALPPVLQAAYESVAGWKYAGRLPSIRTRATLPDYWQLFRQSRWVMASAAALALATTGDYFAVGLLTDAATVGVYYFAFQLVLAFGAPIYSAVEVVLPPLFARLNQQPQRQVEACLRAIRTIVAVGFPAAVALALAIGPAIHFVWRGTWDSAAPAAQILSACVPAWLLVSTGRALIEARGLWRGRFIVLGLYGVGAMGSAAIGCLIGGVLAIAISVTSFYIAFAVGFLLVLRTLGLPIRRTASSILAPLAVTAVALGVSLYIAVRLVPGAALPVRDGVTLGFFVLTAAIGNLLFFRPLWSELLGTVAQRVRWPWLRSSLPESP